MNARARVLRAYGQACAFCGASSPLEIDHLFAGGNQHRAQLGAQLEAWLCRERTRLGYWPTAFILLCRRHHQLKTQLERIKRMPPRHGAKLLQVNIDAALHDQVKLAAVKPEYHGQQSPMIEDALRRFFDGQLSDLSITQMQTQVAQVEARVKQEISDTRAELAALRETLAHLVKTLDEQATTLRRLEKALEAAPQTTYNKVLEGLQRLKTAEPKSILERFRG